MRKQKPEWKLVTDYSIAKYRCGICAGESVRLIQDLIIRDHRHKPTGEIHPAGEVWTVLCGVKNEPDVIWLRESDGSSHTWDDNDFWNWFERVEPNVKETANQ